MGHFSVKKNLDVLNEHFFWRNIGHDVEKFCANYITCEIAKSRVMLHGLSTPLPIPMVPWIGISMDFALGLTKSKRRKESMFDMVDRFSKMVHFIPCHKTNNATDIVSIFFK